MEGAVSVAQPFRAAVRTTTMVEDRRAALRFNVQVPTKYENPHMGYGFTENLSVSGVSIEHSTTSMAIQTEIRMRFSLFMGSFDTVFRGTVVRHTKDGFAVQFVDMGKAQLEVLRRSLQRSPPASL